MYTLDLNGIILHVAAAAAVVRSGQEVMWFLCEKGAEVICVTFYSHAKLNSKNDTFMSVLIDFGVSGSAKLEAQFKVQYIVICSVQTLV